MIDWVGRWHVRELSLHVDAGRQMWRHLLAASYRAAGVLRLFENSTFLLFFKYNLLKWSLLYYEWGISELWEFGSRRSNYWTINFPSGYQLVIVKILSPNSPKRKKFGKNKKPIILYSLNRPNKHYFESLIYWSQNLFIRFCIVFTYYF